MSTKQPISSGTCQLCGQRETAPRMAAHLDVCAPAHDGDGASQQLTRLRFEAEEDPRYWLLLEVRTNAKLEKLDALLRELWLECCGHMSAFRIGRDEVSMGSDAGVLAQAGRQPILYEYDFGSTTSLRAQAVGTRTGALGRPAVRLLARNDPPIWKCLKCAKPATLVCPFCVQRFPHVLCATHAREHEHADEDSYLPVVNSPRMGVCGYTG